MMPYDAWGNITGTVDGNQNLTEFTLDGWGRIVEVHTPEGGTEHYTYDHAGNITSTADANGGTITYRYNMDNSLSYQRFEDRKGRNPVVNRYAYYPDRQVKEAEGGGITYRYALHGERPVKEQVRIRRDPAGIHL